MAPYLGNNFIPNFVDSRRGHNLGRGGYRGTHVNGYGQRDGRDRSRSPTRHADGGRHEPYRRYEDDGKSEQGVRSASLRGLPENGLDVDGLEVQGAQRSDSGNSESTSHHLSAPLQPPLDAVPLTAHAMRPRDLAHASTTLPGLDSVEKLKQFKRQVEASRQANAGREVDTISLAKMAELFLESQKGEETENRVVSRMLAQVSALDALSYGAAHSTDMGEKTGTLAAPVGAERLALPRSDSAPAVLTPSVNGIKAVPSPIEPGEVVDDALDPNDREAVLKERLRERQQGKPSPNGITHGVNGHAPIGTVDKEHPNGTKTRGVSPKTILDRRQVDGHNSRQEGSSYEQKRKNFVTYRSLPADSPEALAPHHRPINHYHSNGRARSPEKMSRSTSGEYGYGEPPQESSGDQLLRQIAQDPGTRASRMSPTKTHHQTPWQQRKNAPSRPNRYHDRQQDREGDTVMGGEQRSPWCDLFLREPFKATKAQPIGSSRGHSPPKQPRPFQNQSRPYDHEPREPPMTARPSGADQEILATLAGLKAQIAKLEAQLPAGGPTIAKPIPHGLSDHQIGAHMDGHGSYERRSLEKHRLSPGVDVIRSRTLSGSRQMSHPYQPLSPRRHSNGSTRPRQSFEDLRAPWKGSSAGSYSRDDTMKRRDEDRYGRYKVSREGREYRYEFVPPNGSQNGDQSEGYESRPRTHSGSYGGGFSGRGRGGFRGRGY